jgi:hypothetical protein
MGARATHRCWLIEIPPGNAAHGPEQAPLCTAKKVS